MFVTRGAVTVFNLIEFEISTEILQNETSARRLVYGTRQVSYALRSNDTLTTRLRLRVTFFQYKVINKTIHGAMSSTVKVTENNKTM